MCKSKFLSIGNIGNLFSMLFEVLLLELLPLEDI